jgi:hypothetical protein
MYAAQEAQDLAEFREHGDACVAEVRQANAQAAAGCRLEAVHPEVGPKQGASR